MPSSTTGQVRLRPSATFTEFLGRDKFSLEFSHEVEYNVGEAGEAILDKDNIALIAGLKSAVSGAQFLLATTHLLFRSVPSPLSLWNSPGIFPVRDDTR